MTENNENIDENLSGKIEESKNEPMIETNDNDLVSKRNIDVNLVSKNYIAVRKELNKVLVGQEKLTQFIMAALLSDGHVLIEGVPGIAKTLTVKLLSKALSINFNRIQFTPDLMPADVTGTSVFDPKTQNFNFKNGPIFSNLVLIDEINRSPAKTQAALFEAMEEKQITFDGKTYLLEAPFMVLATQNPIEQEGTYKLPEAQQDRFLFRINIDYPEIADEIEILNRFAYDFKQSKINDIQQVMDAKTIAQCKSIVEKVHIEPGLIKYIADIVVKTRNNPDIYLGASPRASLSIMKTSKALAAMSNRDFVTPDDIKSVMIPVMNHRLILSAEKELDGASIPDVLMEIINSVEIPR